MTQNLYVYVYCIKIIIFRLRVKDRKKKKRSTSGSGTCDHNCEKTHQTRNAIRYYVSSKFRICIFRLIIRVLYTLPRCPPTYVSFTRINIRITEEKKKKNKNPRVLYTCIRTYNMYDTWIKKIPGGVFTSYFIWRKRRVWKNEQQEIYRFIHFTFNRLHFELNVLLG